MPITPRCTSIPPPPRRQDWHRSGLTVLEVAIAVVGVGILIGIAIVGQSMVTASMAQKQINQLSRLDATVGAFHLKYSYLPGDLPARQATSLGFLPRSGAPGEGDGNGTIEGNEAAGQGRSADSGEVALFWTDLAMAKMIPQEFAAASAANAPNYDVTARSVPHTLADFFPVAAIQQDNFVTLWPEGEINHWSVCNIAAIHPAGNAGLIDDCPGNLAAVDVHAIDAKIDDGMPQTGNVRAQGIHANAFVPSANAPTAGGPTCYETTNGGYALSAPAGACAMKIRANF